MKNLIVTLLLLTYNFAFGQSDKGLEVVQSFVNEVFLPGNFDHNLYQKHIRYYNGYSPSNKEEFVKYLDDIRFLSENFFNNQVSNKDELKIIDITRNGKYIDEYIQADKILPASKVFIVLEGKKLITTIILDKDNDIISFLGNMSKTDARFDPSYLTINLKDIQN